MLLPLLILVSTSIYFVFAVQDDFVNFRSVQSYRHSVGCNRWLTVFLTLFESLISITQKNH